jgi:hypothetical protein
MRHGWILFWFMATATTPCFGLEATAGESGTERILQNNTTRAKRLTNFISGFESTDRSQ